jgi:hypothetical protein
MISYSPGTINMESILDQSEQSETMIEEGIEEKREQLSILAVLGTISPYAGREMSLGDVKKLSDEDVKKIYNRYQIVLGNSVSNGLVNTAIETTINLLSKVVTIDDENELCRDIQQNELVRQELNNIAGYVILKGGRFVALASCLLQVVKHVKINTGAVGAADEVVSKTFVDSLEES